MYNICCFHKFIETSMPIEIRWITLIHYTNSKRRKTIFNMSLHAIVHPLSKFNINRPKWRRNIEKGISIWCPTAILNLQNFDFCQMTILRIEIRICIPNLIEIGWFAAEIISKWQGPPCCISEICRFGHLSNISVWFFISAPNFTFNGQYSAEI